MSFLKRISNAFFWNHINKIIGYLLDFVLSIVLARGLGDYYFGVYSELFNFIFLFSLICSFGIDTAINVYIPKSSDKPGVVSNLLRKTLILIGIASLIMVLFLVFLGEPISELINSPELGDLLKIAAFYIILYNFLIIAQIILVSVYATRFLFFANSILKLLFIFSAYILLVRGGRIQDVIIAFIVISLFISAAYFGKVFKYLKPRIANADFFAYFKFGLIAWITKFINYLLGRYFDIFLLGYFAVSKEEIGYYNIAFSITLALVYFFTSGFGGLSIAAFSEFEKKNNRVSIAKGWLGVTKICIFFTVPAFTYMISNAKPIISIIYSDTYLGSVNLFQIFAVFFLFSVVIGSGINSSVLYSINKEKIVLYLRSTMGLVNVMLDILLIPKYRAMGAIVATGISTVGIIGLENLFVRKYVAIKYPFIFLTKIILASLISFLISIFFMISNIFSLLLSIFIFVICFIVCIFILKPLSEDDVQNISRINASLGKIATHF